MHKGIWEGSRYTARMSLRQPCTSNSGGRSCGGLVDSRRRLGREVASPAHPVEPDVDRLARLLGQEGGLHPTVHTGRLSSVAHIRSRRPRRRGI